MNSINGYLRTTMVGSAVSRRTALRGLGGAGLAAVLAVGIAGRVAADHMHPITNAQFAPISGDDPAAMIEAYLAAANAGDLEAILDLYADDAVHIFLPTPDGSAGVCLGKAKFRMWYEQSLANGDRVELEEAPSPSTATRPPSSARSAVSRGESWGGGAEAKTDLVVIDGRIVTHLVTLTPESVRSCRPHAAPPRTRRCRARRPWLEAAQRARPGLRSQGKLASDRTSRARQGPARQTASGGADLRTGGDHLSRPASIAVSLRADHLNLAPDPRTQSRAFLWMADLRHRCTSRIPYRARR